MPRKSKIARKVKSKVKRTIKPKTRKSPIKKTYSKAKSVARKLNRKPDRKIIEKKAKKFFRKALKKSTKLTKTKVKSVFKKLEGIDLSKSTKAELKQYIKDSIKLVNQAYPTMNKASTEAMKEALKIFGKGDTGYLSDITSGDRKDTLLEKARMLESIINGDGVSTIALIKNNMKLVKAFNTFKRSAVGRNLEDLNFEEYNQLVSVAGDVEKVLGDYYNRNMFQQLHQYKDTLGMKTVGDIMIDVFKHRTPGMTTKDMDLAIIKALKEAEAREK